MKSTAEIIKVDPRRPDAQAIGRAAAVVRAGGVVVAPTTGLYGLCADALRAEAVTRLFAIKHRDPANPILILISSYAMLERVAAPVREKTRAVLERFWPGRVTFVLPAAPGLPPGLAGGAAGIGVRMAAHPVARALIKAAATPLTGTSANLSGAGGCAAVAQLDPAVLQAVDLVLDAGTLGGAASTVADMTGERPVILREGAVPARTILSAFEGLSGD